MIEYHCCLDTSCARLHHLNCLTLSEPNIACVLSYMKVIHKVPHSPSFVFTFEPTFAEFYSLVLLHSFICLVPSVCCLYYGNNDQSQDKRSTGNLLMSQTTEEVTLH